MLAARLAAAQVTLSVIALAAPARSGTQHGSDWDTPTHVSIECGLDGREYVARELLLGLDPAADRAIVLAAIERSGGRVLGEARRVGVLRIEVPGDVAPEVRAASLAQTPGVLYAERNGIGRPAQVPPPNDDAFAQQWHLKNTAQQGVTHGADIDALEAWAFSTGDPSVVLAIVDDGIDPTHPEFAGRLLAGLDCVDDDSDPTPPYALSHGDRCAGLAAANTDNAFGVAGVDRACKILPVRVFTNLFGTTFNLVQGLNYCAAQAPDVVSMSLINYPPAQSLKAAIDAVRAAGCILVCSAGNGGIGNANQSWPGASPNVISIGATDSNDERAGFSATGSALDFVAPGDRVVTVWFSNLDRGGEFGGTSAAAPIAAGIVCLMKAKDRALTHEQAYELLRLGAEDEVGTGEEDTPGRDLYYGWGRLNAWRSLACMTPVPAPDFYGVGTPTAAGPAAELASAGTPRESFNNFSLRVSGATPGSIAWLFFGPEPTSHRSSRSTHLVSGPLTLAVTASVGVGGRAAFQIWVSDAMIGESRCYQVVFADPVHGAALSNAVIVKFGP